jgi:hypothetical protein
VTRIVIPAGREQAATDIRGHKRTAIEHFLDERAELQKYEAGDAGHKEIDRDR